MWIVVCGVAVIRKYLKYRQVYILFFESGDFL